MKIKNPVTFISGGKFTFNLKDTEYSNFLTPENNANLK